MCQAAARSDWTGYVPAVHTFHGNVAVDWTEEAASLLTSLSISVPLEETGHTANCWLRVVHTGNCWKWKSPFYELFLCYRRHLIYTTCNTALLCESCGILTSPMLSDVTRNCLMVQNMKKSAVHSEHMELEFPAVENGEVNRDAMSLSQVHPIPVQNVPVIIFWQLDTTNHIWMLNCRCAWCWTGFFPPKDNDYL